MNRPPTALVYKESMLKRHTKRISLRILGVICLLAGIAGLVLPLLQGFLLIILGLVLISVSTPSVKHYIESWTHRHPKSKSAHMRLEKFILGIVGEL